MYVILIHQIIVDGLSALSKQGIFFRVIQVCEGKRETRATVNVMLNQSATYPSGLLIPFLIPQPPPLIALFRPHYL